MPCLQIRTLGYLTKTWMSALSSLSATGRGGSGFSDDGSGNSNTFAVFGFMGFSGGIGLLDVGGVVLVPSPFVVFSAFVSIANWLRI